ncbi:MAG: response regulator [Candidatus Thiodiazotropha sp. (ex. Lucinisca nassula)]|nr:response regulator [Candidatus Thiodiazotropha sp. (ex. Lucinisca nassula)]
MSGENENNQLLHLLTENLQQLKSSWPILPSGIWNASSVMTALRHLSELTRKSRQSGLIGVTGITQAIDNIITNVYQNAQQPDPVDIDRLNQLLNDLQQKIQSIQQQRDTATHEQHDVDLIYLHNSNPSDYVIIEAIQNNGWQVLSIRNIEELFESNSFEQTKVILIDTQYLESVDQVNQVLDQLSVEKKNRPELIFLTPDCDIEIRLQVLRTGVTQCFTKPININDLILSISKIVSPQHEPSKRVLVVEDDESQANFATVLLNKGGLKTLSITNPLSVLDAVQQFQPDLILMDLYMPGANGIELTQVIREKVELTPIPIVFLSGEDDMEKKLLALNSGADDFLTKPVRPQHLLATVKTRISRAEVVFSAGNKGYTDHTTGLAIRKILLRSLDCSTQQTPNNNNTQGIISVRFSDPDQHRHSETYTALLLKSVKVVNAILDANDKIARTSVTSIGMLIVRESAAAIEQFSDTIYKLIKETLKKITTESHSGKFGIGLAYIDNSQEDTDAYLLQAETASLNAYRQQIGGYLTHKDQTEVLQTEETSPDQFQQQQFNNALVTNLIEFKEQAFSATNQSGNQIIELSPRPAPATDIILISDSVFLTAEQYKLSDKLDQYICQYGLNFLAKTALTGSAQKILLPISAEAIHNDTFIDFIKSELRRLQLVGTGLIMEFNLPALAKDLKKARYLLGELSSLGIDTLLGNFACNETAYKVLAYLNAEGVRPHFTLLKADFEEINDIATQIHSLNAKIILPRVDNFDQVSLYWSEAADYVQSSYDF